MYIELSTDDVAVIPKAIAEAIPSLVSEDILRVTIERDRKTGGYRLFLDSKAFPTTSGTDAQKGEALPSLGDTSGVPRSRDTAGSGRPERQ